MGVGADGDDLSALLAVHPQPLFIRQGNVAPVGVQFDAAAVLDHGAQNGADFVLKAVKADALSVKLARIADRQRQMAQHAELPPVCKLQQLAQIISLHPPDGIILLIVVKIQIRPVVGRGQRVDRADHKIQLRCLGQQPFADALNPEGVSKFNAQPQPNPAAPGIPCYLKGPLQRRPVIIAAKSPGAYLHRIHMARSRLSYTARNSRMVSALAS